MKKNSPKYKKYLEYLKSDAWAMIRNDLLVIHDYTCQLCCKKTESKKLQVHHITYVNLFNEEPGDLILVCSGCHMRLHGLTKGKKNAKKKLKRVRGKNIKKNIKWEKIKKAKRKKKRAKKKKKDLEAKRVKFKPKTILRKAA